MIFCKGTWTSIHFCAHLDSHGFFLYACMYMKKQQTKKKVQAKKVIAKRSNPALLLSDDNGQWGKDQPMIFMLSAGIILCILVALFFTGWL